MRKLITGADTLNAEGDSSQDEEAISKVDAVAVSQSATGGGQKSAGPKSPMPSRPELSLDDFGNFMKGAYRDKTLQFSMPKGFRDITTDELRAAGLGDDVLSIVQGQGYSARVYINDDTKAVVVAFAGSNDAHDWGANFSQAAGLDTDQYNAALSLGTAMNRTYGENVAFTGHSLGGGLASVAALATNRDAVTYNAAGLSQTYVDRATRGRGEYSGRVTAIASAGDPLTNIQDVSGLRSSGQRLTIPGTNATANGLDLVAAFIHPALAGASVLGRTAFENHMFGPLDNYIGGTQ